MNRILPLIILAAGVVLASAHGARLGDRHSDFRVASAQVDAYEGQLEQARQTADSVAIEAAEQGLAEATERRDGIGLPPPSDRLSEWFSNGGLGWLGGCVLILGGAVMARRQASADSAGTGAGSAGGVDFEAVSQAAVATLADLDERLATLAMDEDWPEARDAIDALFAEQIAPLVDQRGQLIARDGLSRFAEYFGPFSGGERNLARLWSALTDGHADAAREAAAASSLGFETALQQYRKGQS